MHRIRLLKTVGVAGLLVPVLLLRAADMPDMPLSPGYEHFYNNEFTEAISYFEDEIKQKGETAARDNHLAQGLMYREMFRNGALESQLVSGNNTLEHRGKIQVAPALKARILESLAAAQRLEEKTIAQEPKNAQGFYELGSTHALRSAYYFLVEKSSVDALREASAARRSNERALQIDRNLVDANVTLGLYQYLVGSLPFYLRAVGLVGGFHGDREAGLKRLEMVSREGQLSRYDARVLLAVLYRREHRPRQAIPLLKDLAARFPRNALFLFEEVQMYSDLGDKESALNVLASIERLREEKSPGYANIPAGKVSYVYGNLHFWYGDLDKALTELKAATAQKETLDLNMAILAWLRLGQTLDLRGSHTEAITAYEAAVRTAPESEPAAEAKGYISNPYRRRHG